MAKATRFTFVGEVVISKNEKMPFVRRFKGGADGNLDMASLRFGVKVGNSIGNVEMFGIKSSDIYTMSTDNEKMTVSWRDRNDAEVIKSVASYKKHFVQMGDIVKEFITEYDAIEYLESELSNFDGKIKVTGIMEKEPYINKDGKESIIDKYIIQNVRAAKEDERPKLQIDMDLYYNKDSVDRSEFKREKIVSVDGYVRQYVRNSKATIKAIGDANKEFFIPQRVILSGKKLDFDDENDLKKWNIRDKYLKIDSSKKMYHCMWRCSLVSGGEEVDFDESQLTNAQRELIEEGLAVLDDFKPSGAIIGNRIREIRLVMPLLKDDFADGYIEADCTLSEFEDEIMRFEKEESLEDIIEKSKAEKDEIPFDTDDDDDFDDDFGI